MKTQRLPGILLIGFVLALVIYLVAFSFIQTRRLAKGPWHVDFLTDREGTPSLLVKQSKLNISRKITFLEHKISHTNANDALVFNDPNKTNAPFGEIVFQDLTFLPGTVTFNFFGHEVELLPRVLIIDKQEYSWSGEGDVSVTGHGKFKPLKRK